MRRIRRSTAIKYIIATLVGAAFYCEWFVFIKQPFHWQELKCQEKGPCTKILFIADPQIQGDLAVPTPLNYLFNWDSDRYLKSTFSIVTKHFKPDVLVYLGDLMDEGSIATVQKFHQYAKRLINIFEIDGSIVNIWIPGDNDIGGENESIKLDKVDEFEKIFKQPSVITFRNIYFYKVNAITNTIPKLEDNSTNSYKIVVSHYPVTIRFGLGHQVNKEIQPNIYFCAHTHEAKYVKQNKDLSHRQTHWMSGKDILSIPDNDQYLYEVYVPTCSYRMGTNKIGFGAAVFENNSKTIRYTVFWSPERFIYLYLYLALLGLVLCYCIVLCSARLLYFAYWWPTSSVKTKDKTPLLG